MDGIIDHAALAGESQDDALTGAEESLYHRTVSCASFKVPSLSSSASRNTEVKSSPVLIINVFTTKEIVGKGGRWSLEIQLLIVVSVIIMGMR